MQACGLHHFKPSHFQTTTDDASQFQRTLPRSANKNVHHTHTLGVLPSFAQLAKQMLTKAAQLAQSQRDSTAG